MPSLIGTSHVDLTVSNLDASIPWYEKVLGATQLFRGRNDAEQFEVAYLAEAASGMIVGLVKHDAPRSGEFDPRVTGLDHLSFAVADRGELKAWASHLESVGVAHSGVSDQPPFGAGLNFTDPDGIALEFYYLSPNIAAGSSRTAGTPGRDQGDPGVVGEIGEGMVPANSGVPGAAVRVSSPARRESPNTERRATSIE